VAVFALIYSGITASVSYERTRLLARWFDFAIDAASALVVIGTTGGASSPFAPLLFLTGFEAQSLQGMPAGLAHALTGSLVAFAASGRTLSSVISSAILLLVLCLQSLLLHRLGLPRAVRSTLMPERTVEDLELLLEAVEDQNRQLRQKHKEMNSAVRRSQSGTEEAAVRYQLLAESLEETDVELAYRAVLDILKDHLDAEAGVVWALDYLGEAFEVRATVGPVSPVVRSEPIQLTSDLQASGVRKLSEQRLLLAVPESRMENSRPQERDGIVDPISDRPNVIAAALRVGDRIVGSIALACPTQGRFLEGDAARLSGHAVAAGLAVRTVEQRAALERGLREISILHDMNLLVQNAPDLAQIYEQIVELAAKVVPFENCTLFRLTGEPVHLEAAATQGRQINLMEHVPFEHGAGVSAFVASHRKQLFVEDLTREPGLLNAELMPPRVRSFISVPMVVRDHVIGAINVSHAQASAFTREQARMLSLLAGQAALTIEREEMVRSLEQLAITDGLTGIFNHRYFQMRLENEVKRARRYGVAFALLLIDIDHFKSVNDRFGHATGDAVLSGLAALLRSCLRETDIIARYGGEEFAVVLTQTKGNDAVLTADRLRKTIEEHPFEAPEGERLRVTVSIGVAACPETSDSREGLLHAADQVLYAAKAAGRNCIETA
jgi:diguanylate cyclase (GGDEF)-like protein